MIFANILKRKPVGSAINGTSPTALREAVTALFGSAVLEYLMEYKTSNAEFIHTIAYGKMMAYRQLAVVLGDDGLASQFDDEVSRVLEARRTNK